MSYPDYIPSVNPAQELLTRSRMIKLTRIYHNARFAAEAVGVNRGSMNRAARRYGLSFRRKEKDE